MQVPIWRIAIEFQFCFISVMTDQNVDSVHGFPELVDSKLNNFINSFPNVTFMSLYTVIVEEVDKLDIQSRILGIVIICLFINLLLIRLAWSKYGDKITDMFLGSGKCRRWYYFNIYKRANQHILFVVVLYNIHVDPLKWYCVQMH